MRQNLRVSLGAVVLALATLAAVIFALINFDQRTRFEVVYDGVAWLDTDHGIQASRVSPNSPATRAGVRPGDLLLTINSAPVTRAAEVARRLDRAGLWTQVRYKLSRSGEEFETRLLTAPAEKPLATENYLRIVGLLYLFIGMFIFIRRWNAPRAVHFYVFCLVSFVLWSFHFSGKLDTFDWEVYWSEIVARLMAPALLLHFALVFPGRSETTIRTGSKLLAVYFLPLALLLVHLNTALKAFVAHRRNSCRQSARFLALHRSLGARRDDAPVDAALRIEPGADPSVFRLRCHPLPLNGCGHHLQARPGVYGGNGSRSRGLLRVGRADR